MALLVKFPFCGIHVIWMIAVSSFLTNHSFPQFEGYLLCHSGTNVLKPEFNLFF